MSAIEQKQFFEAETEESKYTSENSQITYILRFCKGETCCDSPWDKGNDLWPTIEVEEQGFFIVGAVYEANQKSLLGVWAADPGDGHIEYYIRDDIEKVFGNELGVKICEDMDKITGILSHEICEDYKDVLDDGSGTTRDATILSARSFINCPAVANFFH